VGREASYHPLKSSGGLESGLGEYFWGDLQGSRDNGQYNLKRCTRFREVTECRYTAGGGGNDLESLTTAEPCHYLPSLPNLFSH